VIKHLRQCVARKDVCTEIDFHGREVTTVLKMRTGKVLPYLQLPGKLSWNVQYHYIGAVFGYNIGYETIRVHYSYSTYLEV